MKITNWKTWVATLACVTLVGPAYALTINDPGVVGTVDAGTQNSSTDNEEDWSNYLLSLGTNTTSTFDADGNGTTEDYETGNNDYSGTVSGGTQIDDGSNDVSGYLWVLAKYDGQNAGYVLFYVPDLLVANTIPLFSDSIWTNIKGEGYQLSHFTGFGSTSVPDGGTTLGLLGLAMLGLGYLRKRTI